jgi:hypothetical protein
VKEIAPDPQRDMGLKKVEFFPGVGIEKSKE